MGIALVKGIFLEQLGLIFIEPSFILFDICVDFVSIACELSEELFSL